MQQGTFGFRIQIITNCDLQYFNALSVKITSPSGENLEKTGADLQIEDVSAGLISLEINDGDLPTAGCYQLQVIDRTDGRFLASEIAEFEVCPNL